MVQGKRMPGLDGVRAIAVGLVVWHHAGPPLGWLPLSHNGFLGVDMFFVLSGFLITTLLLREQAETGRISLRDFYIRRSLRIFPLYYAVVLGLAAYVWLLGSPSGRQAYFSDLPQVLTYTSNWFHNQAIMAVSWSLSVEEQFYLLWPPLLVWLGGRRALVLMLVFLAFNQLLNFGLMDRWLHPLTTLAAFQVTFTPIVLGVLLAFMLDKAEGRSMVAPWVSGWRLWGWLLAFLAVMNTAGDVQGLPRLSVHLLFTLVLAGLVLQPAHRLVRCLEFAPLVFVGTVSYGVYLLHMPIFGLVDRMNLSRPLEFLVTLLATVAVAGVSFRYFESPILRLKSVLTGRRRSMPLAPAASGG